MRRIDKNEWVQSNFSTVSEGAVLRGNPKTRCYRSQVSGTIPKACDLNVTRKDGVILFHCYSASCECSGACGSRGRATNHVNVDRERDTREYQLPNDCIPYIPEGNREWFETTNIPKRESYRNGVGFSKQSNGIVFKASDERKEYGYLTRKMGGYVKWHKQLQEGAISTYKGGDDNTLIIVEAVTSALAITLTLNYNTMAILGSGITTPQIPNIYNYILDNKIDTVYLMLDPDVCNSKISKTKRILLTKCGVRVKVVKLIDKPRYVLSEIKEIIKGE